MAVVLATLESIEIEFLDSAGRRWKRNELGSLSPVPRQLCRADD